LTRFADMPTVLGPGMLSAMNRPPHLHRTLALGLALALTPALAWPSPEEALAAPAIARLTRLPAGGLQAVETTDGDLLFLSDNGRYAFRGPAVDLWHGARLTDLDTVQRLAGRIDLQRLKLDPRDLGAIDFGEGPEVIVFVDPYCPHCKTLLAALPGLAARYRFRLVPLPVLGEASQQAVLAINCLSATDPEQARRALLGGLDVRSLPPPKDGCGQAEAQRALIAAQILGVQGAPYLIAPDGRLRQGLPEDLGAWLTQGEGTP
jgi:thiol:disulfide interchange protein DsbC